MADPYAPPKPLPVGTAAIDATAVNTPATPEQIRAANDRKARDKEILTQTGGMPGRPGTVQIDPVRAGWQEDLSQKNIWQGMKGNAIQSYKGQKFGYNPYQTSAGPAIGGMNYDPYRSAASNSAQSGAAQDFTGQQSQLQLTGGMSSADRLKAFGNFNRQKILGQLGGVQQYDQAQSGNLVDIGRRNLQREATVNRTNIAAGNDASRDLAQANLRRDQNLYEAGIAERDLNRQLEASRLIGSAQAKSNGSTSILDRLLNPLNIGG